MGGARDPLHLRATLARAGCPAGSAVVYPHFSAHRLLEIIERCGKLSIVAGADNQRLDRMLRSFGRAGLQRAAATSGRPAGQRSGVLESSIEIALIGDDGVRYLLIFRQADDDVGSDTLTLYRAPGGCVVERGGQPQCALPLKGDDGLDRALAKAPSTHHRRPMVIL